MSTTPAGQNWCRKGNVGRLNDGKWTWCMIYCIELLYWQLFDIFTTSIGWNISPGKWKVPSSAKCQGRHPSNQTVYIKNHYFFSLTLDDWVLLLCPVFFFFFFTLHFSTYTLYCCKRERGNPPMLQQAKSNTESSSCLAVNSNSVSKSKML